MDKVQVALKSAGPAGSTDLRSHAELREGVFRVWWPEFMLATPRPADQLSDVQAARAALAESDDRVPYTQIRRELGLGE